MTDLNHSAELKRQADIVNPLAITLRSAEIHDLKNVSVAKAINTLVLFITSYLRDTNYISLELRGDFFFINESRIRYSPELMINLDYLARLFRSYDLGSLILRPGIGQKDLLLLLKFLVKTTRNRSFHNLKDNLALVSTIDVEVLKKSFEED